MINSISPRALRQLAAIMALAAVLAACSRGGDEPAADTAPPAVSGTPADAAAPPVESPDDARMANGVATGNAGAAVDLKYDVLVKPAVGQPFEVELALLPRLAADVLEVEVTGVPGLTVVSGGGTRFEGVTAGARHAAKVLVQADEPGIYYASVVARMITPVQTEARTFAVPVVVGAVPAAIPSPPAEVSGAPAEPEQP
jgi:hypothetical protein